MLVALVVYSNDGEALSGQQLLALAHNDGWRKIDQVLEMAVPDTRLSDAFMGREHYFLKMIAVLKQRLKVSPSPRI
jgi:hypothetical protein